MYWFCCWRLFCENGVVEIFSIYEICVVCMMCCRMCWWKVILKRNFGRICGELLMVILMRCWCGWLFVFFCNVVIGCVNMVLIFNCCYLGCFMLCVLMCFLWVVGKCLLMFIIVVLNGWVYRFVIICWFMCLNFMMVNLWWCWWVVNGLLLKFVY